MNEQPLALTDQLVRQQEEIEQLKANLEQAEAKLASYEEAAKMLRDSLTDTEKELEQAESSREHCQQWYAVRLERLNQFIRDEIPQPQKSRYFAIIANETADVNEPPTYSRQMNMLQIEKEQAEACAAEMRMLLNETKPKIPAFIDDKFWLDLDAKYIHALSADCGKGILERVAQLEREVSHRKQVMEITHPVEIQVLNEKVKRLEEVVIELSKELQNEWEDVLRPFCNDATAQHARAVINRACAALAGAKQALETEAK